MIGGIFGGNIGLLCGTVFFLFLIGLIIGLLARAIMKTMIILVIILIACSFLGVVMVNWAALKEVVGAAILIFVSLPFTSLPFAIGSLALGFILGIVLSRKRKR